MRDELVDDDDRVLRPDRRAVARLHPGRPDLLDGRRPDAADRLGGVAQLGLVDLVVATDDRRHEPAVAGHEEGGLGRALSPDAEECRERGDGRRSRSGDFLEGQWLLGRGTGLGTTATWRLAA